MTQPAEEDPPVGAGSAVTTADEVAAAAAAPVRSPRDLPRLLALQAMDMFESEDPRRLRQCADQAWSSSAQFTLLTTLGAGSVVPAVLAAARMPMLVAVVLGAVATAVLRLWA